MTLPLIGITGRKRSGKDTVAARIIATNPAVRRVAFADPMKAAALALDPIAVVDWSDEGITYLSELVEREGWEAAKEYPEVRRTLQRLGTEMGRVLFGQDFWVDRAFDVIDAVELGLQVAGYPPSAVVTDVRFENEADAVLGHGGYLIRVTRPGVHLERDAHASETEMDAIEVDFEILNDGTLDQLHDEVDKIVHTIRTLEEPHHDVLHP